MIQACSVVSLDGRAGYDLGRPNVLEGRLPRADRPDEVLVTHGYAETFGGRVGDELDLVLPRDTNPPAGEATGADGAVIHVTIVGIGVAANQVVTLSDHAEAPTLVAGPALVERYAPDQESWCYDGALLELDRDADIDAVMTGIDRISGPTGGALVQNLAGNYADVPRAIQPQVSALWLFAAVAGIATLLVVAQLVGRQFREVAGAVPVSRAMGMRRSQVSCAVVVQALLVAGASMLVGLPLGMAAGRLSWAGFASDLGVADTLRLPIATLALAVPCVLAVAVAVALVPAIPAARSRAALVLRSE